MAYHRITADSDRQKSDEEFVRLAVFAVKCPEEPEGFCLALLVFGAIRIHAMSNPVPSKFERAKIIEIAMEEVAKEQSCKKVAFGLLHTKETKGN